MAPSPTPITVETAARSRRTQPPASTREKISRPRESPPNQASELGEPNVVVTVSLLEYGARKGPTTATRMTMSSRPPPTRPRVLRNVRRTMIDAPDLVFVLGGGAVL